MSFEIRLDAPCQTFESSDMLELEQAHRQILDAIRPLAAESVSLESALNRYSAGQVESDIDLPSFDNSAMDGYAVRAEDVAGATLSSPISLRVIGKVAAGEFFEGDLAPQTCIRLFTGSPLPRGANAVVMQEDTLTNAGQPDIVQITDTAKPWENVRFKGGDVKRGAIIVRAGEKLTVGRIALLGAIGVAAVNVARRPIVGLLATGSELVEAGQPLTTGKIYESNRVGLAALARLSGAETKVYPLVRDDTDATVSALRAAFAECDAVVTSGGVSVGEYDFIKGAFEAIGGELGFWKVNIKPGKPFVFGQVQGQNAATKFLFGVPGNPVSALVTFFLLVRPALSRMQGSEENSGSVSIGRLVEPITNSGDRRHFVRVAMDAKGNVRTAGVQASHILSALANANGLVDVPPKSTLGADTLVSVQRWD